MVRALTLLHLLYSPLFGKWIAFHADTFLSLLAKKLAPHAVVPLKQKIVVSVKGKQYFWILTKLWECVDDILWVGWWRIGYGAPRAMASKEMDEGWLPDVPPPVFVHSPLTYNISIFRFLPLPIHPSALHFPFRWSFILDVIFSSYFFQFNSSFSYET